jgi:hypothetical protein
MEKMLAVAHINQTFDWFLSSSIFPRFQSNHREEIYREETDTSITWIFVLRVPRATQNLPASKVKIAF